MSRLFVVNNLRLKNHESDVPALIAQQATAGIANEPHHYALVNFEVVFNVERNSLDQSRIFHRIRCEIELKQLRKIFKYDIPIDLMESVLSLEIAKAIYSEPLGQVVPGEETAIVRLIDGEDELLSIQTSVCYSNGSKMVPQTVSSLDY